MSAHCMLDHVGASTTETDAALIAAVAAGDDAAMARLYDRFTALVQAVAVRMLRDRALADELAEDVFVEIWRRSSQYDATRGSLATWIATIARSRGIDRIRARQRQGHVELGEDDRPEAAFTAPSSDPAAGVVASEDRVRINRALRALSPEQREALELAYFAGLTQTEIAARLSRPLGTVKTHMRQGLIRMRDELRTQGGSGQ